jgi:hypothetical protein
MKLGKLSARALFRNGPVRALQNRARPRARPKAPTILEHEHEDEEEEEEET